MPPEALTSFLKNSPYVESVGPFGVSLWVYYVASYRGIIDARSVESTSVKRFQIEELRGAEMQQRTVRTEERKKGRDGKKQRSSEGKDGGKIANEYIAYLPSSLFCGSAYHLPFSLPVFPLFSLSLYASISVSVYVLLYP